MALLYADAFPYTELASGTQQRWSVVGEAFDGTTIQTSDGRFGGRWLQLANNLSSDNYVRKTVAATPDTVMLQCGFQIVSGSAVTGFVRLMDSESVQVSLSYNSEVITAYRGTGTLLGTATANVSAGVWHQLEIKVKIHDTAGTFLVKVDGVTLIDLSDIDTKSTANAYSNGFEFHCGTALTLGISDIIFMDTTGSYCNDLLGSCMVELKVPSGAGHYTQFTPSAGDNYACVDEVPANTTDYTTGDVDEIDTFTKAALANPNATIYAVDALIYAKTNDGGSAMVESVVRSNDVDGFGPEIAVPSSYDFLESVIYVDPNTSAQFTAAGLDAAEFGYKRTA